MIYIKKDKAKQNGDCPLYIKVIFNRKSITLATGKYISEVRWKLTDNLRRVLRLDKEKVLKEYLDLFVLKIEKIANQLERDQEEISIEEFKLKVLGKELEQLKPCLLDIIEVHNVHFSKLVAIGERSNASLQKYERVKELIRIFNLKTFGTETVLIEKIGVMDKN